jgi:hypothetical protein
MSSKKSQRSVSTAKPPVTKLPPANETTPEWETRAGTDWRMPIGEPKGEHHKAAVENISRTLYLEVCRDDHGLVHAIFPMDFGHFEEATDPAGCLIQFDKKGGTALSLFKPGEWMVLRAPKFERLTGEISTEKFGSEKVKSVASRCTGKHSTLEKAQAFKIALGTLGAFSKSHGHADMIFSVDPEQIVAELQPNLRRESQDWFKALHYQSHQAVVDTILSGPPYRREWITSGRKEYLDRMVLITANRLFVSVILALLPNEDGSMHPYGGQVGAPSGSCLTPNCEGHIGDEPCVSAQPLHEGNGDFGPVTAIDGLSQLSQIKATFNAAMSTKIATPFMILGHNSAHEAACALIPHLVALGYTPFSVKINPVNDGPKTMVEHRIIVGGANPGLPAPAGKHWWADHGVQLAVEQDPMMTEKVGIIYSWITASTSSP